MLCRLAISVFRSEGAGIGATVVAYARAARRDEAVDLARRREKAGDRVLGVDTAFDGSAP